MHSNGVSVALEISLYGGKNRSHTTQSPRQLEQPKQLPSQPPKQLHNNSAPQEYASLYNIGLSVVPQGNYLIVVGDDIFAKKDSIKAYGFRWNSATKCWEKPIEQRQAA